MEVKVLSMMVSMMVTSYFILGILHRGIVTDNKNKKSVTEDLSFLLLLYIYDIQDGESTFERNAEVDYLLVCHYVI